MPSRFWRALPIREGTEPLPYNSIRPRRVPWGGGLLPPISSPAALWDVVGAVPYDLHPTSLRAVGGDVLGAPFCSRTQPKSTP